MIKQGVGEHKQPTFKKMEVLGGRGTPKYPWNRNSEGVGGGRRKKNFHGGGGGWTFPGTTQTRGKTFGDLCFSVASPLSWNTIPQPFRSNFLKEAKNLSFQKVFWYIFLFYFYIILCYCFVLKHF